MTLDENSLFLFVQKEFKSMRFQYLVLTTWHNKSSCSFHNGSPRSFGHRRRLTDRQTFFAGSHKRVIGVRYEASLRALCHRNPHPRGILARELWVNQGLCEGLDINPHEIVVLGLTTCGEVRFVSWVHLLFDGVRIVTTALKCKKDYRRLKKIKQKKRNWMQLEAQNRKVTNAYCMHDMKDAHNSNLSHDVMCKSWRSKPDYWTMRTWDQACIIHVLKFMFAVWKVLWVFVVTLSLVSYVLSLGIHHAYAIHM